MITTFIAYALVAAGPDLVSVESQHLQVTVRPATHEVLVQSEIRLAGAGTLHLQLTEHAEVESMRLDGQLVDPARGVGAGDRIELAVPRDDATLTLRYRARLEEDVESGERPGQIHNFAVQAHVGPNGVFLSDGSGWHPRPLGADGRPALHRISIEIAPLEGWAMVASGDPRGDAAVGDSCWSWTTPRPVDGMAVVGNRHVVQGLVHETPEGPVEIVMHVPETHAELAPMFLEAARSYLDLYVPRLGAFPYKRFTIVENFFSSGFAFPGFTVLGPQVVGMAPRSLAPGYLDHELLHCWWGNGVYVDPDDGNWCEALTSYGANYFRRVADNGAIAGRDYRRGILMKLSTDPKTLDDGALGAFGSADPTSRGPDRFVGYDKGAFVFAMLGDVLAASTSAADPNATLWACLRRFARDHVGRRAGWAELQSAFEAAAPARPDGWLDEYFDFWVREHHVPQTLAAAGRAAPDAFTKQLPAVQRSLVALIRAPDRARCEIDPGFRIYRVLPAEQLVPTIAGTTGPGGLAVVPATDRAEMAALLAQLETDPEGENLLLVGNAAVRADATLLTRVSDRIEVSDGSFTVGDVQYDEPGQAVLHTMAHPDRPGRFITVFVSNGESGWSRLRLIRFYSRDTTVVWDGRNVIERRVFEPERWIELKDDA